MEASWGGTSPGRPGALPASHCCPSADRWHSKRHDRALSHSRRHETMAGEGAGMIAVGDAGHHDYTTHGGFLFFYFSQGAAHSQDLAHFVRNTHAHSHVCVHTCTSLSLSHTHWKWHWGQDNGFVWAVMMRHVRAVFYLTSRTDVSMAVTPHCLISLRPVNHH